MVSFLCGGGGRGGGGKVFKLPKYNSKGLEIKRERKSDIETEIHVYVCIRMCNYFNLTPKCKLILN